MCFYILIGWMKFYRMELTVNLLKGGGLTRSGIGDLDFIPGSVLL